jgi:hypothetical protein
MPTAVARFEHTDRYVVIDRPRRLVFTWISAGTDCSTQAIGRVINRGRRPHVPGFIDRLDLPFRWTAIPHHKEAKSGFRRDCDRLLRWAGS